MIATAVVRMPSPGIRRPSSRSYIGVVKPSTTPNIHTNAATVMNSGTVTKKPVMKLRRSQCMLNDPRVGYSQPAAIAASSPTPAAIRYQANGAKPDRATKFRNGFTTTRDARKAMTKPTPISSGTIRRQMAADLEQIVEKCRRHRRHRQKKRELGGRPPIESHQHAADDRGARSRHPRNQRQRLEHADRHRPAHRNPLRLPHHDPRPESLDHQHHDAADDERHGDRREALVQHALDEIRRETLRQWRRARTPGAPPRAKCRSAPGVANPITTRAIRWRYSHITARTEPN